MHTKLAKFKGELMRELKGKTLKKLREIINDDEGKYNYRSGPNLIEFFNKLGFNDEYKDFPSRKNFTEEKLKSINGTEKMDKCILLAFDVIDFVENIQMLDELIESFNIYLAFDNYQIRRDNIDIIIEEKNGFIIETSNEKEKLFLDKYSAGYDINILNLDKEMEKLIELRIAETKTCLRNNAPLSAIFLMGSILEGILYDFSCSYKEIYLKKAKEKNKKIKRLQDISLNDFITISYKLDFLKKDVYDFSHDLRKFRNYIHPINQIKDGFNPDMHTANICWAVLQAVIYQLSTIN